MNKKLFFDSIRKDFGSLNQSQVEGIEFILDSWVKFGNTDNRKLAYTLGTIHHETDAKFQPIEEYGKGKGKLYGTNVKFSKKPYFDTKNIFYGRGYTQNTWYENYAELTRLAELTMLAESQGHDWDFFNKPELLLQKEPSIWATFEAMKRGLYTGKKLSDYFNDNLTDWFNARRIINILDKAKLISDYSQNYYKALCLA